jgi:pimeloyl-ACP methyl ester carboxylesterase
MQIRIEIVSPPMRRLLMKGAFMRRLRKPTLIVAVLLCFLLGSFVASNLSAIERRDIWLKADSVPAADISGRVVLSGKDTGTIFMLHGYRGRKEMFNGYEWLAKDLGWNLVSIDFREHGQSTHSKHLCSLGYFEVWDVKAAVDWAEANKLPKPYVIYGNSMGASIGLRWASMDSRVKGVFALSPYANAMRASRQLLSYKLHFPVFSPFVFHRGFAQMLRSVHLPGDLAKRDDLRIAIMVGEKDSFPISDQHEILNGSASPANLKSLYVVPNGTHGHLWSWQGDDVTPSHDRLLGDFLRLCRQDPR